MKKRIAALVLALAVMTELLCLPSASADPVYFTAVNETVLELSESTMPFWSGGYLYVPYTVFADSDELGLSFSRNQAKQTLVFWMPSRENYALVFDLKNNTVTDGRGAEKNPTALVRGSVIFVPVGLMATSFGLSYTLTAVSSGYLVRVRSSRSVLSDAVFVDAAASQLEARYEKYCQSLSVSTASDGEDTQNTDDTDDEDEATGRRVCLCVSADDADTVTALLDVLAQYSAQATFYCTESFTESEGDLLRRMVATGQGIGLQAESVEQARRMNDQLFSAACTVTRLVRCTTAAARSTLTAEGFSPLTASLDRSTTGLLSSTAKALLEKVSARSSTGVVWLGSRVTAAGLRTFLTAARSKSDRVQALGETTR